MRRILRYAVAVATVGATLGLRAAINPWIKNRGTYLLFLVAIAVSAWNGGFGPAILATALSILLAQWFLVPAEKSFSFETPVDIFLAACFLATAVIISMIVLLLTRDRTRLRREAEERRRAEGEVLRLNQELERRVRERTRDLEGALLELEAFSYTVAHDLRAPLRAMKGFADLVLDEAPERLKPEEKDYLRRITRATVQMDALVRDLLAYSSLGHAALPAETVGLGPLVATVLDELRAELRDCQAQVDVEPGMPDVVGHEKMLRQVVSNLLSNAAKFVAAGTAPRIRIAAQTRGPWVRLLVEDNGIGVAAEYHERIFKVFERLHRSEIYAGTGIGLAIVRRAVERMGGQVGVESEVGKGSRFWIELPEARSIARVPEPVGRSIAGESSGNVLEFDAARGEWRRRH